MQWKLRQSLVFPMMSSYLKNRKSGEKLIYPLNNIWFQCFTVTTLVFSGCFFFYAGLERHHSHIISPLFLPGFLSASGCYLLKQPPGPHPHHPTFLEANIYVSFLLGCSWHPLRWPVDAASWSLAWGKQRWVRWGVVEGRWIQRKEVKAKAVRLGVGEMVELGENCRGKRKKPKERGGRGEHLGMGLDPAWTSCGTCSIVCLASTSE